MNAAIEIRQVSKTFRGLRQPAIDALRRLNLAIAHGEVFGLLGPNGAGKSTTIWIVMGMLRPSQGSVHLLGGRPGKPSLYRRIGFVPENFGFHRHQTLETLLALYARLLDPTSPERILANAEPLIERFGLATARRLKLRKFSKGMLQKIALIQALAHDPELVILDEPSANLDPAGRKLVREIIEGMRLSGKTTVVSSHILSEIEAVCDRVAILDRGQLRGCFQLQELLRRRDDWVVDCSPLSEEQAHSLASRGPRLERGGHFDRIYVAKDELWNLLDWLRAERVELLAANPQRVSLEETYLRLVGPPGGRAA